MATSLVVDLYARISDDQTGQAVGTDNQIQALTTWAESRGWIVGQIYRDDSVSATSGKRRPGFEALLERKEKRAVAVYALDRLARLAKDMERVLSLDLTVYSLTAGDLDLSTPDGRLMARVATSFATAETEKKRARSLLSNAAAAAKGTAYWKRRPFGNNMDGSLNAPEAEAIQWAARHIIDGGTVASVVREWNKRGLRTPVTKTGNAGGNEWNTANLRGVLHAQRIAGLRTYQGTTVPGTWTAPLSEETWRAMIGTIASRKTRAVPYRGGPTPQHLLTRFATCPKCGTTVERAGTSYRCPKGGYAITARVAEHMILQPTFALLTTAGAFKILATHSGPEVDAARAQTSVLRDQLTEWEAAAGSLGVAEYLRITTPLRADLAALEDELASVSVSSVFDGLTGTYEDREAVQAEWDALGLDRQRTILTTLWSKYSVQRVGTSWQIVDLEMTPLARSVGEQIDAANK